MPSDPKKSEQYILLFTLLDLLKLKDQKLENSVNSFWELLDRVEPLSSFHLLRLKLKDIVRQRDLFLLSRTEDQPVEEPKEKDPISLTAPVDEILERALELLEEASISSGGYSDSLEQAISELKQAKDMVSLKKLSHHLVSTGESMHQASTLFRDNLGELSLAMFDYQNRIRNLEREVDQQKANATTDSLTGVLNRRAFDQRFPEVVSHALRFTMPLCLFLVDLDYFKKINDTHGHQVGDDVLVNFVRLIRDSLEEKDMIYRYGGDEFVVLLPQRGLEEARALASRVRDFIKRHPYRYQQKKFSMSISGGLACLKSDDTAETFFHRADQLLYRAKKNGRDQITVQQPV